MVKVDSRSTVSKEDDPVHVAEGESSEVRIGPCHVGLRNEVNNLILSTDIGITCGLCCGWGMMTGMIAPLNESKATFVQLTQP